MCRRPAVHSYFRSLFQDIHRQFLIVESRETTGDTGLLFPTYIHQNGGSRRDDGIDSYFFLGCIWFEFAVNIQRLCRRLFLLNSVPPLQSLYIVYSIRSLFFSFLRTIFTSSVSNSINTMALEFWMRLNILLTHIQVAFLFSSLSLFLFFLFIVIGFHSLATWKFELTGQIY